MKTGTVSINSFSSEVEGFGAPSDSLFNSHPMTFSNLTSYRPPDPENPG
jgi:hypothetical protein